METNLKDVFSQNQYNLKDAAKRSKGWFQQQARLLQAQHISSRQVLKGEPKQIANMVVPGSLYMFLYDPKTKDDMPYYDMFPLVFPFKKVIGGFYGLNLHYLPYQPRIILLQRLMDFANNRDMNETTKLKLSWNLINGVSRFKWAEPCVKRYLKGHIRSTMRKIQPQDWATAMLLPVEQFVGANKATVWQESLGR